MMFNRVRNNFIAVLLAVFLAGGAAADNATPWWKDAKGPGYQVLVYSFATTQDAAGGYGNLKGLTDHLDYLNDGKGTGGQSLDVSALWLSPIFKAGSYHGYDIEDYYSIDPKWGTLADFDQLVTEAHKRGIKVILDVAFNHTGRGNPWFKDFADNPLGPHGTWYVKKDPTVTYGHSPEGQFYALYDGDGNETDYFSSFWQGMPDLNVSNPEVAAEMAKILKFWVSKGVDGFRFDAAKHIFNPAKMPAGTPTLSLTKKFWSTLRDQARSVKPDLFTVGEVYSLSVPELVAYGACFDSVFDFAGSKKLFDIAGGGGTNGLDDAVSSSLAQFSKYPEFTVSNFLTNHDQDRILSQLNSRTGFDDQESDRRARFMAAVSETLPGLPWIYYGEELGMVGTRYMNDDVGRRDAFPWTEDRAALPNVSWALKSGKVDPELNADTPSVEVQNKNPRSMLNFYRRLAALRFSSEAIRTGTYQPVAWPGFSLPTLYSFERKAPGQTVLVVHNLSKDPVTLPVPADSLAKLFWTSDRGLESKASPQKEIHLDGSQSGVWVLR